MPLSHRNIQAIFIVCLGWMSFSLADACSKYLVQFYEPQKILLTNGVIGTVLSATWLISQFGIGGFKTPHLKWQLLRMLCTVGSSFCVVNALGHLPLADFYGITFISPFVIALFSFLLLGEHVGWRRVGAMIFGFCGILVLAGPQYESHNIGLLWALLAPVCLALNVLCIRKMGHKDPLALFAFFPFIGIMLFNTPMELPTYTLPDVNHLPIFVLGTCGVMGGLIGTTLGFSKATESAVVAPFLYTQILWGVTIGYFIFGNIPTITTFIGAGMVIAAGLYSFWREHKLAHQSPHSL
jgi:drug/metabolite transporter (DMT)-like permease